MSVNDFFNEQWYLSNNPDVRAAVEAGAVDARTHFELHGRFEGRSPSPAFDPAYYLEKNPDVKEAVEDGLVTAYDHFLLHGQSEARAFVPFFDVNFYLQNNDDIRDAVGDDPAMAVAHFLLHGQGETRPISPFFDLNAYLEANADVKDAVNQTDASALQHLLLHGFSEGRPLGNGISLAQFANDPVFQDAADPFEALARVAEVVPFMPNFEPPAGWEAPADTPIPQNFVPVEGEHLVVPPTVEVPDDTELPDAFEPAEPSPGPGPGEPTPPTFSVSQSSDDATGITTYSFGGTAAGNITVTLTDDGAQFVRQGVTGENAEGISVFPVDESTVIDSQQLVPGDSTVIRMSDVGGRLYSGVNDAVTEGVADDETDSLAILVGSGEYEETVQLSAIKKDFELLGPNSGLSGTSTERTDEAVIDGSEAQYAFGERYAETSPDVLISGMTVLAGSRGGITQGQPSDEVGALYVSDSIIISPEGGYAQAGNGISVSGESSVISNNLIETTEFQSSTSYSTSGIAVFDFASGTSISGNTIRFLGEDGISAGKSITGVGLGPYTSGSGLSDITVGTSAAGESQGNVFEGLSAGVVTMGTVTDTAIRGNEFTDNGTGISFGYATGFTDSFGSTLIEGNTFSGNGTAIAFSAIDAASTITISGNTFSSVDDMEGAIRFSDFDYADGSTIEIDITQFVSGGGELADGVIVSTNDAMLEAGADITFSGGMNGDSPIAVTWEGDSNFDGLTIELTGVTGGLDMAEIYGLFGLTEGV